MLTKKTISLVFCLFLLLTLTPADTGAATTHPSPTWSPEVLYNQHPAFQIFREISEIPRCSGNEQAFADWIIFWAAERGWSSQQDSAGNLLVHVSASPGLESADTITFQCHLDMACVDTAGNRLRDDAFPLKLVREGDWLSAEGTTLGADNGIAIAVILTLAEREDHGPFKLLFTTGEEVGIVGASHLDLDISERMINLDNEFSGTSIIGSAGYVFTRSTRSLYYNVKAPAENSWEITVNGLTGGHSGVEIYPERGNAAKILARVLDKAFFYPNHFSMLGDIQVKGAVNAIPKTATAEIWVAYLDSNGIEERLRPIRSELKKEFASSDSNLAIIFRSSSRTEFMADEVAHDVINFLLEMPDGVISMSLDLEDVPYTSSNVGVVKIENDSLVVEILSRSFSDDDLSCMKMEIDRICQSHSATVEFPVESSGWEPNPDSYLLQVAQKTWGECVGENLKLVAVHAGLEAGAIQNRCEILFPNRIMDVISLGPQIEKSHTSDERASITSVVQLYNFMKVFVLELVHEN
ncbi:MAG: beta-Ala-His dipeptidase [Candidatus Aenigmatarchaeota archaeon]